MINGRTTQRRKTQKCHWMRTQHPAVAQVLTDLRFVVRLLRIFHHCEHELRPSSENNSFNLAIPQVHLILCSCSGHETVKLLPKALQYDGRPSSSVCASCFHKAIATDTVPESRTSESQVLDVEDEHSTRASSASKTGLGCADHRIR